MTHNSEHLFWLRMTALASLAGILYSSWPLGYMLNPGVSSKGLASALEALNQPYNWIFITGDVLSSILVLLICWLIWRHHKADNQRRFINLVLANIAVFALGTVSDTLLPERCLPGAISCPSWRQDHLLLVHGIISIVASLCLFLALAFIWWRNRIIVLHALLLGYIGFGLLSLYEAITPTRGNFSQHYYITLCGIWIALLPYCIHRTFLGDSSEKKSSP